ncbi:MAG: ctaF [Friedmanniella sp.]|nr:ctaF [Friedmanniella sp.]
MKVESWVFLAIAVFCLPVTPVYYLMSKDLTGTFALMLTFFLALMVGGYLALVSRRMDPRAEDRKLGEIAEGAGELGFFPPQSIWPLFVALTFVLVCLGPVFGWWLTILGFGAGGISLTGLLYQYYRGDYAH